MPADPAGDLLPERAPRVEQRWARVSPARSIERNRPRRPHPKGKTGIRSGNLDRGKTVTVAPLALGASESPATGRRFGQFAVELRRASRAFPADSAESSEVCARLNVPTQEIELLYQPFARSLSPFVPSAATMRNA